MSQEEGAYIMIAAFTIVPVIVLFIFHVFLYRVSTTLGINIVYYGVILLLLSSVAFFTYSVLYSEFISIILYLPLALLNLYYAYSYIMLVR
jgi:hypothetical protein